MASKSNILASSDTRTNGEDMESQVATEAPDVAKAPDEEAVPVYAKDVGYKGILKEFVLLGWTAFGGPAAHIGLFERRFVQKLKWLSSVVFIELLALGQCMPGPTSTQMSFAIGMAKVGPLGGLLSGALFQYPGLLIMAAVGVGAAEWLVDPDPWLKGVIAGLAATAVALVASAAKGLCSKICSQRVTAVLCTISAAIAYYYQSAWLFPTLIVVGGLVTYIDKEFIRKEDVTLAEFDDSVESNGLGMFWGGVCLFSWIAILVTCVVLVNVIDTKEPTPLDFFEKFFRIGSMIYGGGQVVLPLMQHELVFYDCPAGGKCVERPDSWVTEDQYFAGLAVVQGMPGPLFNFAAYLGAIIAKRWGYNPVIGIVLCWVGLFGPGIMIIYGIFPFWHRFRAWSPYRKALPGLNAAAIGLVVTAVFQMTFQVYGSSPFPYASVCIGVFAFGAVDQLNLFEPAVIVAGGVLGAIAWAADCK